MKSLKVGLVLLALLAPYMDAQAHVKRSQSAKAAFVRMHPCPASGVHRGTSCPGYVIDHKDAIDCGGLDKPINMQWQTIAESKAKDRIERIGCKNGRAA